MNCHSVLKITNYKLAFESLHSGQFTFIFINPVDKTKFSRDSRVVERFEKLVMRDDCLQSLLSFQIKMPLFFTTLRNEAVLPSCVKIITR